MQLLWRKAFICSCDFTLKKDGTFKANAVIVSFQSYKFNMSCVNQNGGQYSSEVLHFTTSSPSSVSFRNNNSNRLRNGDPDSTNYLNEMEMDPLPAISSSIVRQQAASGAASVSSKTSISNGVVQRPSRSGHNAKISPHTVLGKCILIQ